ncbi:hypothetical protein [Chitinophaga sp. XS-30]|uniref:hypothetical protein n=1 Tax=Chitinophaga sp. XS-30 TaxID=2604421 RepID=UPI00143D872B|nr:hypothetical protein [Chitinophaga sp. XS-30]
MKKIISKSITVNKAALKEALLQPREQQAGRVEHLSRKSKESGIVGKLVEIREKAKAK